MRPRDWVRWPFSISEFGFIPFAHTGGGDYWCWQPEFAVGSSTRVLCCNHDCHDADIYAPDFISAIHRHIIESAAGQWVDTKTVEANRQELIAAALTIAPFISPAWHQTLLETVHGPVVTARSHGPRSTDWYFLVSTREYNDIVCRDLGGEYLDGKVRWMRTAD